MVAYAIILIVAFAVVSGQVASETSKMGSGFIDTSGMVALEMGMGIWIPLIGGIACVVLDFMRASRTKVA